MSALPSDQESLTLAAFVQQIGASRFVTVQDGEVICLEPESPEAQEMYQQVLVALAAGAIRPAPPPPANTEQE